eukprot:TRINITY_DN2644_c0_g2_i1.p1 TRINITY_DN2644_c0_g2~~TRINITY_DN2644_c0_g2_i1.p1  ORF type:complete len:293 (+),score=82.14 TRINITY_DN2644_c0_g2_i1:953-1831(+)
MATYVLLKGEGQVAMCEYCDAPLFPGQQVRFYGKRRYHCKQHKHGMSLNDAPPDPQHAKYYQDFLRRQKIFLKKEKKSSSQVSNICQRIIQPNLDDSIDSKTFGGNIGSSMLATPKRTGTPRISHISHTARPTQNIYWAVTHGQLIVRVEYDPTQFSQLAATRGNLAIHEAPGVYVDLTVEREMSFNEQEIVIEPPSKVMRNAKVTMDEHNIYIACDLTKSKQVSLIGFTEEVARFVGNVPEMPALKIDFTAIKTTVPSTVYDANNQMSIEDAIQSTVEFNNYFASKRTPII